MSPIWTKILSSAKVNSTVVSIEQGKEETERGDGVEESIKSMEHGEREGKNAKGNQPRRGRFWGDKIFGKRWSVIGFKLSTHRLVSCPENAEIHRTDHCIHHRPFHMDIDMTSCQCYGYMLANGTRPIRFQESFGDSDRP